MLETFNDVIKQVSEQALIPSGDSLTVDGNKAATVVAQNVPLAKEAYEALLRAMQDQTGATKGGQGSGAMIYMCVLTALAGGIANVTGDNSYVTRLSDLNPQ